MTYRMNPCRFTDEECEDYDVGEPLEEFRKGLLGYRTKFRALSVRERGRRRMDAPRCTPREKGTPRIS